MDRQPFEDRDPCQLCGRRERSYEFGHRCTYRVGWTGSSHAWRGRILDPNGKPVHVCDHIHRNRDQDSKTWGTAATSCAGFLLRKYQVGAEEAPFEPVLVPGEELRPDRLDLAHDMIHVEPF